MKFGLMAREGTQRRYVMGIVFALALIIPSLGGILHSPAHQVGVLIYVLLAIPFLTTFYVHVFPALMERLPERNWQCATIIFLALVCLISAVVNPLLHAEILPGVNVRDSTLNLAVGELLNGRYPYYVAISKTEAITPLPGSILLAIPFVQIATSGWQNFFWLFVLWFVTKDRLRDSKATLLFFVVLLVGAPVIIQELFTGSDLLSNCAWTVVLVAYVSRYGSLRSWQRIAFAMFSGIAFSSRLNFLSISPLLFSALVQSEGAKEAIRYGAIAMSMFVAITAPFYLYDPAGFSPLTIMRYVHRLDSVVPHANLIVPALGVVASLALSFTDMRTDSTRLFGNCAIVLALPVLAGIALTIVASRAFEVGAFSNFGTSFVLFAAMALFERRMDELKGKSALQLAT